MTAQPWNDDEPTATGWLLMPVAMTMPDPLALHLLRLVRHFLELPSRFDLRERELGLVIELVTSTGGFVATTAYDEAQADRARAGESWPTRRTLTEAYGGWVWVVRTAMDLWRIGGQERQQRARRRHPKGHSRTYPRPALLAALRACRDGLGRWPSCGEEYSEWRRLELRARRHAGLADDRVPALGAIRRAFGRQGGFVRAVELAAGDENGD